MSKIPFDHLRICNIKGLKECDLLNLGKINIICGKNNSGKSTILEGINSKDSRSVGTASANIDVDRLYSDTIVSTGWRGKDGHSRENLHYRQLLQEVVSNREMWFNTDSEIFCNEVVEKYHANGFLRGWSFVPARLLKPFESFFPASVPIVLLPPTRDLEPTGSVESSTSVEPDGKGLLRYLFLAKNQPNGSDDRATYDAIQEACRSITSGYTFDVFAAEDFTINLYFAQPDCAWIRAEDCGFGLRELLVILYFALHPSERVVLIEEPESHIHPDMQRKLLTYLRFKTSKQYFIATHSNIFLNNTLVDRVFFTYYTQSVKVDDATERASILDDLGYSVADNLASDLVILVEGPSDAPVIEEFLLKLGLYQDFNIKIWPLGGDIMGKLDLSVFTDVYNIIALVDSDPGSKHSRNLFVRKCKDKNITVHRLKRYAIENYFPISALRSVYGNQVPATITEIDQNIKLEDQIRFNVKKRNKDLAQATELTEIEGTDLWNFLKKCEKILKKS